MSAKVVVNVVVFVLVVLFEFWILGSSNSGGEGESIFMKLLGFVVGGLYLGFLTVAYVLPAVTGRLTEEALGSSEQAEPDPLAKARQKLAIGEYEEAIEEFRRGAAEQPEDRMPWIEISKIYLTRLDDAQGAVAVLKEALEGQEWPMNDAAALMFKVAELYAKEIGDSEAAESILKQVVEMFPETRHSANATHKLREMGAI